MTGRQRATAALLGTLISGFFPTASFARDEALYVKCSVSYAISDETAGSVEQKPSRPLLHIHKITSTSFFDLDTFVPGMVRWGQDRCYSNSVRTRTCQLSSENFILSDVSKNDRGEIIIDTELTIDRIHGTFSEVTRFPLKRVQSMGSGICIPIPNPLS